jgi:hypothetical protein
MQDCWQQDPKMRPSFNTIARRLKAMQHWFYACSNALHISNTTVRFNNLRQNSNSSKPVMTPLAVGSFKQPQHDAAAAAGVHGAHAEHGPAMGGGVRGLGSAAAAMDHHPQQHPHAQQQQHPQQQQHDEAHHFEGVDSHEDAPPPVPEPEVAAAAKAAAPKPSSEPCVQV